MQPHSTCASPRDRKGPSSSIPIVIALIGWVALIPVPKLMSADSGSAPPSLPPISLSADQVVDNLVRKNQERAQALMHSEGTRVYHLAYRGFPSDRDAEMTVKATYDSPSSKEFKIVSESGSKLILNRVFKKLLESEKEAAQPAVNARTQLNRDNYDFELRGLRAFKHREANMCCTSRRNPAANTSIWVRCGWMESISPSPASKSNPAQNPSFWTKKSEIHHEYKKVGAFWLPARNESVSYIRLGGRATLTIEYTDYRVRAAGQPPKH